MSETIEKLIKTIRSRKGNEVKLSYTSFLLSKGNDYCLNKLKEEITEFEDAIRNSISLGGDSDTQACITGSLAEAHYKIIPDEIASFVRWRIEDDLLAVMDQFHSIPFNYEINPILN